jgi:hypothetical protein
MTRISDMFQPRWLKPEHLAGRTQAVIEALDAEQVNGDTKLVLRMRDLPPLIVNAKQAGQLAALYGDETEAFAAQRVTLVPCEYRRGDGTTGRGIDICAPEVRKPVPKPAPRTIEPEDGDEDEAWH